MDSVDNSKTEYQEQGPKKGIVIIVITILLGTNGLLLWQFFDKKSSLDSAHQTIISTTAERDALQVQLNQVKTDYEKVKADNVSLQNQLTQKDDEIRTKVTEIQKLISLGGPAQIARAKAELAKLREMNQVYVVQIDSLNHVNAQLTAENQNLNTNLSQERSKNDNLSSENSKLSNRIAQGSVLKAMNILTTGIRYKSNGKEVETNKATQIQKIKTQFTLGENRVMQSGPIDIYFRVLGPDGSVMSSNSIETFSSGNQTLVYTLKQTIDYNNADTPVEVMWAKGSVFAKGKYNVEIYQGGSMIGNSLIELK